MNKNKVVVLIECRQIAKDGIYERPFKLGDTAEWICEPSSAKILPDLQLDFRYDKLYDMNELDAIMYEVSGTVEEIKALYHKRKSCPHPFKSNRIVWHKVYMDAVVKTKADGNGNDDGELLFWDYAVTLNVKKIQRYIWKKECSV